MTGNVIRLLLLGLLLAMPARAQSDGLLQVDDDFYLFLLRQHVAGRLPSAQLSHQPLSAYDAAAYLDSLDRDTLSDRDRALFDRFRQTAPAPGAGRANRIWSRVYANGHDLVAGASEDWAVQVNPILIASYGMGRRTAAEGIDASPTVWQNTRGIRVSGHIGPVVFFEGRFTENATREVKPVSRDGSVPRRGFAKIEAGGYNWMDAVGVVGVRSRYLEARFGRDRLRWGYGLGSPFLSNYAPPFDHLQLKARFWRIEYVSLFTGYSSSRAPGGVRGDQIRRRKYGSTHRLAVHLPWNLEVGIFETVVFATDSLEVRERFDLSYLNPVIFLRAVERDRGSPDNVLLGASAAWRPLPGVRVFGEFMLDEFKPDYIGKGWWANKWAWTLGVQTADLPVPGLLTRLEVARIRPFMYSHDDEIDAYVHFGDLLGHPAGPNAWDVAASFDYMLNERVRLAATGAVTIRGRNDDGVNYGSDPLLDYAAGRLGEFDHWMLQGVRQRQTLVEAHASYELLPRLWADASLRYESTDDAEEGVDRWITPFLQLRWGVPFPSVRY